MIPRVGKSASEIPMETQMLLLEVREESALDDENSSDMTSESTFYVLFLPVLDGPFRTSLQGTSENVLQFCVESGKFNFLFVILAPYLKPHFIISAPDLVRFYGYLLLQEIPVSKPPKCWKQF